MKKVLKPREPAAKHNPALTMLVIIIIILVVVVIINIKIIIIILLQNTVIFEIPRTN